MPTYDPDLAGALRSLQRQIDQINTALPGPMSWGPGDGHTRFYGADGTTVLFEAVGGVGASVVSRGVLTGLTPLLDGIRSKNDDQDGRLDGHDGDVSRIDAKNSAQDGTLAAHDGRITTAQARADSAYRIAGAAITDASNAQSRADSAYSLADSAYRIAGAAITDASNARARADSAFDRAADAQATANAAKDRADQIDAWLRQHTGYPDGGLNPNG